MKANKVVRFQRTDKDEHAVLQKRRNDGEAMTIADTEDKLIDMMNREAAVVQVGGQIKILCRISGQEPLFLSESQAKLWLSQFQIAQVDGGTVSLKSGFPVWLKSGNRRTFSGVEFDPAAPPFDLDDEGGGSVLNLWGGFASRDRAGDWSLLRSHIYDNICKGDHGRYSFLMGWMAQIIQEPEEKSGVCVVLRGDQGVGKSVVAQWLADVIGEGYCPVIDSPELLSGRFNGHLETAILVCCEEGFYPGDPHSAARLKNLITAPRIAIERKNVNPYMAPSFARVLITTNSDWVISAAAGERRYFMLDVGSAQKQNGVYFAAIAEQMRRGGSNAMFHDLKRWDYSQIDFRNPPMTEGLASQIRLGFNAEMKWLEAMLVDGAVPFKDPDALSIQWKDAGPLEVEKDMLLVSYREHVPGFRSPPSAQQMGTFLAKFMPGLRTLKRGPDGARVRMMEFPALMEMRTAFSAKVPGYVFDDEGDSGIRVRTKKSRH